MYTYLDFETRSLVDIKECGSSKYSRHESTVILCGVLKRGNQIFTVYDWKRDKQAVLDFIGDSILVAHNAKFEQDIWNNLLVSRFGYPVVPLCRWKCTMAKACAASMPRALEKVADVLGLLTRKDLAGQKLMLFHSNGNNPYPTVEQLFRIAKYCLQDVLVTEQVDRALPDLTPYEQEVWQFDREINQGGIGVDLQLVKRLKSIMEYERASQLQEFKTLIPEGVELSKPSEVGKLKKWIESELNENFKNFDKHIVTSLLSRPELPSNIRRVLDIRIAMAKSSTAKLDKFISMTDDDGIIRNLLIYHGAHTGRWAGADVQPQNFPRPEFDQQELLESLDRAEDVWPVKYGSCANGVKSLLRGCFIA